MKYALIITFIAAIAWGMPSIHAQDASSTTNSTVLAEELVTLLQLEKTVDSLRANIRRTTAAMGVNTLRGISPEISEKGEQQASKSLDIIFSAMSWDKMKPIYVSVYAETFSPGELQAMINFYKTNAGQKWIEKQPLLQAAVMQKSMSMMREIQNKIVESVNNATPPPPPLPDSSSTSSANTLQ